VADAEIAGARQAVELDADAPEFAAFGNIGKCQATLWRHGQRDLSIGVAQLVIARDHDRWRNATVQDQRSFRAVLENQLGRDLASSDAIGVGTPTVAVIKGGLMCTRLNRSALSLRSLSLVQGKPRAVSNRTREGTETCCG